MGQVEKNWGWLGDWKQGFGGGGGLTALGMKDLPYPPVQTLGALKQQLWTFSQLSSSALSGFFAVTRVAGSDVFVSDGVVPDE